MPKSSTESVCQIGSAIVSFQTSKGQGDLHSGVAKNLQIDFSTNNAAFCKLKAVHFLSQAEIERWCVGKWSNTMDDRKKATYNDKLRALGIAFTENMRLWIPYLLLNKDPRGLLELDTWTGERTRLSTYFAPGWLMKK